MEIQVNKNSPFTYLINTMQIDHIGIWVMDLEKMKDFYRKYFDCNVNKKYKNPAKHFSSYFLILSNGVRIELMKQEGIDEKSGTRKMGIDHIAINVGTHDKVDSLTRRLQNDGYIVESLPRLTGDGYYESVILDPENNRIELTAVPELKISKAHHTDLEQILYLQKCCYLQEAEIYKDYSIPPLTQTLEDIAKDFAKQTILKLECNSRIIGSVRGHLKDGTCHIGKLIVNKEHQNHGYGSSLIKAIEGKFKNAERYELFTGFKSTRNLYLYKKLGYKEFKEENRNGLILKYLEKNGYPKSQT